MIYIEKQGYWPEGTIAENCHLADPSGRLDEARLERCLEICLCTEIIASLPLKIHNPIASDWSLLSDGESQRLFLAFAMYHTPDVLVLDEALSHIPFEARKTLLANIRAARPNLVLILISHNNRDAELVDEVIDFPKGLNQRIQGITPDARTLGKHSRHSLGTL
jgi:ATP-binding cassette subfamily B protein